MINRIDCNIPKHPLSQLVRVVSYFYPMMVTVINYCLAVLTAKILIEIGKRTTPYLSRTEEFDFVTETVFEEKLHSLGYKSQAPLEEHLQNLDKSFTLVTSFWLFILAVTSIPLLLQWYNSQYIHLFPFRMMAAMFHLKWCDVSSALRYWENRHAAFEPQFDFGIGNLTLVDRKSTRLNSSH